MTNRLAIAIGGLGYPIQKFIPSEFKHFTPMKTRLSLVNLIENHNGPITLLGFSWGAEIAIRVALMYPNKNIEQVIAHSPGKGVLQRHHDFGPPNCLYRFLVTQGDKLCYESTNSLYEYFKEKRKVDFLDFPYNDDHTDDDIPWVMQKFMIRNHHQFVNAIDYLKKMNWGL